MTEIKNKEGNRVVAWSVVLTAEEMVAIAGGCDPLLIRPDKLVYYSPLPYQEHIRENLIDTLSDS